MLTSETDIMVRLSFRDTVGKERYRAADSEGRRGVRHPHSQWGAPGDEAARLDFPPPVQLSAYDIKVYSPLFFSY